MKKIISIKKQNTSSISVEEELAQITTQMQQAYSQFNFSSDDDMIDSSIFLMKSLTAKYKYLLKTMPQKNLAPSIYKNVLQMNDMVEGEWK